MKGVWGGMSQSRPGEGTKILKKYNRGGYKKHGAEIKPTLGEPPPKLRLDKKNATSPGSPRKNAFHNSTRALHQPPAKSVVNTKGVGQLGGGGWESKKGVRVGCGTFDTTIMKQNKIGRRREIALGVNQQTPRAMNFWQEGGRKKRG